MGKPKKGGKKKANDDWYVLSIKCLPESKILTKLDSITWLKDSIKNDDDWR